MKYKYNHAVVGGTFDLLHKGHKSLILKAFKIAKFVSLGITSDNMSKNLNKIPYQNQNVRKNYLSAYLKKLQVINRAKIIIINHIYGTTLKDKSIDAIVVSEPTIKGASKINSQRKKSKLKKLQIIKCPQVFARDKKLISSTRIRSGQITTEGTNLYQFLNKICAKPLSEKAKNELKEPLGKIISARKLNKKLNFLIAVGDVTAVNLLKAGYRPKLSVVDFKVKRKQKFSTLSQLGFISNNPNAVIFNPAGQVSKKLILQIYKSLKSKNNNQVLLVKGEEDLATIPAILLAPLGTIVCYGQPNRGMVVVNVNEDIKSSLIERLLKLD